MIDAAAVTLCAALAGAVYMTAVVPSRAAAEAAARDREALCEKQRDISENESAIGDAERKLNAIEGSEARDKPPARTPLDRISRISELAQASGVSLTEVSPGAERPGAKYNQSPLSLKGSGRMPGFMSLLSDLHREFPDTQLVSLTLTGRPEQPQVDQAMSAELVWYTLVGGAGRTGSTAKDTALRNKP